MQMKIWLVERPDKDDIGYDEYDSFVCQAHTADEARSLHPDPDYQNRLDDAWRSGGWFPRTRLYLLNVALLGISIVQNDKPRVILASFNAG